MTVHQTILGLFRDMIFFAANAARTGKSVALVGNGPVAKTAAPKIDAHNFVVHFNTARHFGEASNRIDALVLVNTGGSGRRMVEVENYVNPAALEAASEVWIARHPDVIAAEKIRPGNDPLSWEDFSEAIIAKLLRGKKWRFINAEHYMAAHQALQELGASQTAEPSTGIVALFHLRHTMPDARFTLFGFTHQGWHGHAWDAELRLVQQWSRIVRYGEKRTRTL